MNRNLPHSRRRARAIAISDSIETRRVNSMRAVFLALASLAVLAEAALLAHRIWAYA